MVTKASTLLRLLASASTLLFLCTPMSAQVRIPKRPPGFTLGSGAASAGVHLEAYVDLVRDRAAPPCS